jgi:hypothetical protein
MTRTTTRAAALAGAVALLAAGLVAGPASTTLPSADAVTAVSLTPVTITSPKLPRRPPTLVHPIVLRPKNNVGDLRLNPSRDYRIILPSNRAWKNARGLSIAGGRNVVVVGGTVDVGDGWRDAQGTVVKRAAYLRDSTGIVHIEGVRFLSSTTQRLTEGIDVGLPKAHLRLENIWISSLLTGSQSTNHADALQVWAGPRSLVVDGFTASTQYQGMFLLPTQHASLAVGTYDLRRVWLDGRGSGYLLWRDKGSWPIRTSMVHVTGAKVQSSGLWPQRSAWPYVKTTRPATRYGGTAGFAYRTPGYL